MPTHATGHPAIDKIDAKILRVLQKDGRISNLKLAEEVHLSPTAVLERVKRLTRDGFILGYEARLNPAKLGAGLLVFVEILLDRTVHDVMDNFKAAVQVRPMVVPSGTAASRSALMPIDSVSSARPSSRNCCSIARSAAWGRRCASSPSAGSGIAIRPRSRTRGKRATA